MSPFWWGLVLSVCVCVLGRGGLISITVIWVLKRGGGRWPMREGRWPSDIKNQLPNCVFRRLNLLFKLFRNVIGAICYLDFLFLLSCQDCGSITWVYLVDCLVTLVWFLGHFMTSTGTQEGGVEGYLGPVLIEIWVLSYFLFKYFLVSVVRIAL